MNKLDDLVALVNELDKEREQYTATRPGGRSNDHYIRIQNIQKAIKWESAFRDLLPIALAAREIANHGAAPAYAAGIALEDYQPQTARALSSLSDSIEKLQQALAALEAKK